MTEPYRAIVPKTVYRYPGGEEVHDDGPGQRPEVRTPLDDLDSMEKAKSIALGVPIDQDLFEMQAAATRYHSEKAALMVTSRVAYDYLFGTVDEYENAAKLMQLRDADIAMKFYGDHSALGGDIVPIPRTRIDNLGARLQGLKDADVARRKRTGQRSLPTSHDLRDVPAGANVEPIHDDHAPQAAVL